MAADGTVSVNLRSPAYYLNGDRDGDRAGAGLRRRRRRTPQWKVVARDGRYEFHDHRMHWMGKSTPPQVKDTSARTKIVDWKVPLQRRRDGRRDHRDAVLARLERRPAGGRVRRARPLLVLASAAAVVVVRRRRRAAAPSAAGRASRGGVVRRPRAAAGRCRDERAVSLGRAAVPCSRRWPRSLLAPAGASAHAILESTTPQRGATLARAAAAGRPALQRAGRGQLRRAAGLRRGRQARRRRPHRASRRRAARSSPSA